MSTTYFSDAEKLIPCLPIKLAEKMGLAITSWEQSRFHSVQFGADELKAAADEGFVLVAMPSTKLRQLSKVTPVSWRWNEYMSATASVYQAESGWFNSDWSRTGYMLLRPTSMESMLNLNWFEQTMRLPDNWEVPRTVEVVYALMAMSVAGMKPQRTGIWMRTRDEGGYDIGRVIVSLNPEGWVEITFADDEHEYRDVGLAVAKQVRW